MSTAAPRPRCDRCGEVVGSLACRARHGVPNYGTTQITDHERKKEHPAADVPMRTDMHADRAEIDKLIDELNNTTRLAPDDARRAAELLGRYHRDHEAIDRLRAVVDGTTGLRHSDDAGREQTLKDPASNKAFFAWAESDKLNDLNRAIVVLEADRRALTIRVNDLADHALCRLQVGPDGVVPGDTAQALELWHEEAKRQHQIASSLREQIDATTKALHDLADPLANSYLDVVKAVRDFTARTSDHVTVYGNAKTKDAAGIAAVLVERQRDPQRHEFKPRPDGSAAALGERLCAICSQSENDHLPF